MKKIIVTLLILIIIGILGYGILFYRNSKEKVEEDNIKGAYYIEYNDGGIGSSNSYILEMDESGSFNLEVSYFGSAIDFEPYSEKYSSTLSKEEFEKVTKILSSIKETSKITNVDNYNFYLKSDFLKFNYEDGSHLTLCLSAIQDIAKGDVTAEFYGEDESEFKEFDINNDGNITEREIGNFLLDTMIEERKIT